MLFLNRTHISLCVLLRFSNTFAGGNYWVWSKILENLADLEYDSNTMTMEAYDWRLGMKMLEERDSYFTHLKFKIETYHKISGEKVVLTSHSMGAIVVHYFFAWVTEIESKGGGGGGKNWVDDHIHAYVNIAGSHLGVPKAASALASGETSDSVFTGGLGNVVERFLPRKARREMYSTWGSLWAVSLFVSVTIRRFLDSLASAHTILFYLFCLFFLFLCNW